MLHAAQKKSYLGSTDTDRYRETLPPENAKLCRYNKSNRLQKHHEVQRAWRCPALHYLLNISVCKQIVNKALLTATSRPTNCHTYTLGGSEACYTPGKICSQLGTTVIDRILHHEYQMVIMVFPQSFQREATNYSPSLVKQAIFFSHISGLLCVKQYKANVFMLLLKLC